MNMIRHSISAALLAALGLAAAPMLRADVIPHALISNGAVLQQGASVPVWGTADEGEQVAVLFRNQVAITTAKDGKWLVRFKPMPAGGPFKMIIKGNNRVQIDDIMVGEVWVCSGQSNMYWPLSATAQGKDAIAASADPMLRLFTVPANPSAAPRENVAGAWARCGPDTVAGFSAVAYFFGRELRKARKVPVGLIHSSVGGTPAEAWTSRAAFEADPDLRSMLDSGSGGNRAPTVLYNGMIAPLMPYAIRGVVWYQGEANVGRAFQYRTLFPTLIRSWRQEWGQGEFPFLFVQLAPYRERPSQPQDSALAELREAQLLTSLTVPRTAMAVITDFGDCADIHPVWKQPVGARLALAARAIAYRERIECRGPIYHSRMIIGDRVYLTFSHVDGGLESRGGELKGLAVAGDDRTFHWAEATIRGNQVVVSSPAVPRPIAVRYGWADCPDVNLYNKAGLPASPFRTDDFPMVTRPNPAH